MSRAMPSQKRRRLAALEAQEASSPVVQASRPARSPGINPDRLKVMQDLMPFFEKSLTVRFDRGFRFSWDSFDRSRRELLWRQRRGSHYPMSYRPLPFGGTGVLIISQLIRWVRELPVAPLACWHGWCSETIGFAKAALPIVIQAGWPEEVPCIFCGKQLGRGRWDWFDYRDGLAGPGCHHSQGPNTCTRDRP